MGKELNKLNKQIAQMREALIREALIIRDKGNSKENILGNMNNIVPKNPNRPLFSLESLRGHNVPGYGINPEELER